MSQQTPENLAIGKRLVELCNARKGLEAVQELYDEKIVSIEAQGSEELPARMEGIEAVQGKNAWWYDNHEIHAEKALGPFCGAQPNQFGALFELDVTFKPSGERQQLTEVALYTIGGGKIVQEEFWYLMD